MKKKETQHKQEKGCDLMLQDTEMTSDNFVLEDGSRGDINAFAVIGNDNHSALCAREGTKR